VLDASIWSLGSPTFNPPNLSGTVSERTTMEAMITRSDNTATEMLFKLVGASRVRRFIASAGLQHTLIPDSTRALVAYVFGAQNYLDITWDELLQLVQGPVFGHFSIASRLSHLRRTISFRTIREPCRASFFSTKRH
jgi:beta-lactamase class A